MCPVSKHNNGVQQHQMTAFHMWYSLVATHPSDTSSPLVCTYKLTAAATQRKKYKILQLLWTFVENSCTAPCVLDLALYPPHRRNPWYLLDWRLGRPQNLCGCCPSWELIFESSVIQRAV